MAVDTERRRRAEALIPRGTSDAQSIFKTATCLAYADGLSIQDAVDFGTEEARKTEPTFTPDYDVALLTLDSP